MNNLNCKLCGNKIFADESGYAVCDKCGARQLVQFDEQQTVAVNNYNNEMAVSHDSCDNKNLFDYDVTLPADTIRSCDDRTKAVNDEIAKDPDATTAAMDYTENKSYNAQYENLYQRAVVYMQKGTAIADSKAAEIFRSISGYKDSDRLANMCDKLFVERKKMYTYIRAQKYYEKNDKRHVSQAMQLFKGLGDFSDSEEYYLKCKAVLEERTYKKRSAWLFLLGFVFLAVIVVVCVKVIGNELENKVEDCIDDGEYEEAIELMGERVSSEYEFHENYIKCLNGIREERGCSFNENVYFYDMDDEFVEVYINDDGGVTYTGTYFKMSDDEDYVGEKIVEIADIEGVILLELSEDGCIEVTTLPSGIAYSDERYDAISELDALTGIIDIEIYDDYVEIMDYEGNVVRAGYDDEIQELWFGRICG